MVTLPGNPGSSKLWLVAVLVIAVLLILALAAVLCVLGVIAEGLDRAPEMIIFAVALAVAAMHLSYGIGFWEGAARSVGGRR